MHEFANRKQQFRYSLKINTEMILSSNVWLGLPDDLTQKNRRVHGVFRAV